MRATFPINYKDLFIIRTGQEGTIHRVRAMGDNLKRTKSGEVVCDPKVEVGVVVEVVKEPTRGYKGGKIGEIL